VDDVVLLGLQDKRQGDASTTSRKRKKDLTPQPALLLIPFDADRSWLTNVMPFDAYANSDDDSEFHDAFDLISFES
jgi:hypothetical protein